MHSRLLIALIPFIALSAYALSFNSHVMDEYTYLLMARSYSQGDFLNAPDASRFPVFPLLLSLVFSIAGESILVARLFNILLGAALIALVYFAGRKLFGEQAGFWAAALLGASPFFAFIANKVLTESLFVLLLFAGVLLVRKAADDRKHLLALGPLFALLVLTRFFGLYLAPIALAYWWHRRKLAIIASKEFTFGALAALAAAVPWFFYSHALTGDPLGLFKDFFSANVQLVKGGFSLTDRIPSYVLAAPFVAGAAIAAIVARPAFLQRKWRDDKVFLFLSAFAVIALVLEAYGFLHFRLVRYLLPAAPFLAVLAGAAAFSKEKPLFPLLQKHVSKFLAFLLLANVVASVFVLNAFGSSQKYSGYSEAGQFAAGNCESYYSNIERIVRVFSRKQQVDAVDAECYVLSTLDPKPVQDRPSGMQLVYESKGMQVFKRNA